jgi:glutamate-ammonia-ligase adenylyltransferase
MKSASWASAIKNCADPARAGQVLERLAAAAGEDRLASMPPELARVMAALFSGSIGMSNLLVANPSWLNAYDLEAVQAPRGDLGLRREMEKGIQSGLEALDYASALQWLRQFRQREMIRIAMRDLGRLSALPDTVREISNVADACLEGVYRICWKQLTQRHGLPWHQDADEAWQPTRFCVLGMGKLGGRELNYSSDVDLIFIYSEEGGVFRDPPARLREPRPVMTGRQFFTRLAEAFVAEVTRMTPVGMLYRVDLRLRPEGDSGPLCRSLADCENYYAQWGQTWERMMLIKARAVAGDPALGGEFLEMVQPFRYPHSLGVGVVREIAAMKDRIETEVVKAGELDRNVKLGRGGIREIEFVAQTLQIMNGGRMPFLQNSQTLPTLAKLVQYHLLKEAEAGRLSAAYCFLRDVEHRLQMEENRQTHTIPEDKVVQERLARLMGFDTGRSFFSKLREHNKQVRQIYDKLLRPEDGTAEESVLPSQFEGAGQEWAPLLERHWFRDPDKALKMLREFVEGPGYVHVSSRTIDLARKLLRRFFALCRQGAPTGPHLPPRTLSDPDRVLTRLDSFITAYGARSMLFEMWHANPSLFELMLLLFDRSEYLAEVAIHTPDMVEELLLSGRLRQCKNADETLRDLQYGIHDEDQLLWLRKYHQTEQMRIGLRDILELAGFEDNLREFSALADACVRYALDSVLRKHKLKKSPIAVIALGKFGGSEINYGSDLDLVFVAAPGARNLPKIQRLAAELMDMLSSRMELGTAFKTDARLRPDGEKGLLVNTLDAYEDYYRKRAQLWEIQSISRTRAVAGDAALGRRFQELAASLSSFTPENVRAGFVLPGEMAGSNEGKAPRKSGGGGLTAYSPDWKQQIHRMRMRIEKERTPAGKDALAIKTGRGGLIDAEFMAQALCMEQGWQEANTLKALERLQSAGVLQDADKLLANYRPLRRLEGILRRWSFEGETVLPDDPAPFYRVSVRCGYSTPEGFREAIAGWRQAIREVYLKVFAGNRCFPMSL